MPRTPRAKLRKARPLIKIDWKEVQKMCEIGCTGQEIAGCLGVCPDTIYQRCIEENGIAFSVYATDARAKGFRAIRDAQHKVAIEKLSVPMLIHLGKCELGQMEARADLTEKDRDLIIQVMDYATTKKEHDAQLSTLNDLKKEKKQKAQEETKE